ncbi:prefoldin subunit beta [Candidatus Micrarchaeota archaeon]|nr:prefoldin subunit beta [Candidatus Micrarchaeota archaeon]
MEQRNPELERALMEYQNAERQLQSVMMQKHQLQLQLNEIGVALEELGKAKSDIYRAVGGIVLKTTKAEAEKDLKEKKELFDIRLKALSQQEEKMKSVLLRIQKEIEGKAKGM